MNLTHVWENAWYRGRRWVYLLLPLSWLFRRLAGRRRARLEARAERVAAPVVVVGNISVGGTGKTPVIIALVQRLQAQGYRPGVVSRGYGGEAPRYPLSVTADTPVAHSGDEPLAIARATGCPVCVDPRRPEAARALCEQGCDIILSDDGLQHYRLARDLELAVVDGDRPFGNGHCLPVGPLREPVARLDEVDWVLLNGDTPAARSRLSHWRDRLHGMSLVPGPWRRVADDQPGAPFAPGQSVHAVAGIGHPERFFRTLTRLGLVPEPHPYPDHHAYHPDDLRFEPDWPVVMTAKDAVKCRAFAPPQWWYLNVVAELPEAFWDAFLSRVADLVLQYEQESREP